MVFVVDRDFAWRTMHAVGVPQSAIVHSGDIRHPATEAMRRQQLIIVESASHRATEFPELAADDLLADAAAGVAIPLVCGTRAIGAVTIGFEQPRVFDADERSFMLRAGGHIAQAAVRALMYERAERARADGEAFRTRADRELRERRRIEEALRESEGKYRVLAARAARLYELSAVLSEAVALDDVARVIVRHGKAVVGASAGSVALLVDGGAQFQTLFAESYTREAIEALPRFPAEAGLCSTSAVETRQPVYIGSLEEWQKQYPRSAAFATDGGYESAAVLPLFAEGGARRAVVSLCRSGELQRRLYDAAAIGCAALRSGARPRAAVRDSAPRAGRSRIGEPREG